MGMIDYSEKPCLEYNESDEIETNDSSTESPCDDELNSHESVSNDETEE